MIRAFLALEPSDALRQALVQLQRDLKQRLSRDLRGGVRLSWVQPLSLHLTVKFLGDIDEHLVGPMRQILDQALAVHSPIVIPLQRLGLFPGLQKPRVLWVGPQPAWERSEGAEQLASLHRAVEDCCVSLNLAPDSRPMSPHLTLARIKEGERAVGQVLTDSGATDRALALDPLVVGSIVLMKSDLKPTGSVYSKLWEIRMGKGQ